MGAVDAAGLLRASRVALYSFGSSDRNSMVIRAASTDLDSESVETPFFGLQRENIQLHNRPPGQDGRGGKMCKR